MLARRHVPLEHSGCLFPWHTHRKTNMEELKTESEVVLLATRFTLRGMSVWSSHAWKETTGYRQILCVQQYGLVTRTPP